MSELNEIIGYLCPMSLFENRVPKGSIFKRINEGMYNFNGYIMPTEIVKRWNPVYKDDSEIDTTSLRKIKGYVTIKDLPECKVGTIGKIDPVTGNIFFGIHFYSKEEILRGIGEWFEFILESTQLELLEDIINSIRELDNTPGLKRNQVEQEILTKYKIEENENSTNN